MSKLEERVEQRRAAERRGRELDGDWRRCQDPEFGLGLLENPEPKFEAARPSSKYSVTYQHAPIVLGGTIRAIKAE